MRGKWNRNGDVTEGPSANKYNLEEPSPYKPKLLHHSPSLRAIRAYNELSVEGNFQNGIDVGTLASRKYDSSSIISRDSLAASTEQNCYDYVTVGTISISNSAPSELNSEMGSTVKLVPSTMELSCQTWCSYISTTLCTVSMAAGMGNLYRLPQSVFIRDGLPFLIAHVILTLLIGLPLLFLELGIGQLAQEGFIKSWRAVPFFKGIGYVKLIAGCLLSIYYPLYMGISLFYIVWILKGPVPFRECTSGVKMTESGYSSVEKNGLECLRETFLKQPTEDPYWYGIFAGFVLVIWIIITVLSIRKTKSYIRSLIILLFPTTVVYIILLVKSIMMEAQMDSLRAFFTNVDWASLCSANIWYYASVQVFFSTTVGSGSFVTNAGIIYNKVNPCWTAVGYIIINILFGIGSVIISQSLTNNLSNETYVYPASNSGYIAELYLISIIYDIGSNSTNADIKTWMVLAYSLILLTGFISMVTLTYTLLKALTIQSWNTLKWWHVSIIQSFLGYILGCAFLFQPDFDMIHLLDHYVVGNFILICTIIEVLAFIAFYGIEKIRSDFEFMLGHILSKVWLVLWWILPVVLTLIFAWGMITLPLEGIFKEDPAWLYGIGWGIVLCATVFIFIIGITVVCEQDGYTMRDKLTSAMKPSKNWGPKDPISRHNWVQWNTKAQQGERDFTLKRKGTKDYTRSIKKTKKAAISELSVASLDGIYKENNKQSFCTAANSSNELNQLTDVNTLVGRIEEQKYKRDTFELNHYHSDAAFKHKNPLSLKNNYLNGPEEYGTFRKGPYMINDNMEHVCYRRYNENEDATAL